MTQAFKTLQDVIALAEFAHRNQTDKAGMPYIKHPMRVMHAVQTQGCMPYVQMAAVLHDVTEDTRFTPAMLLELGVPEAAVEVVKLLDRDISRTKFNKIETEKLQVLESWKELNSDEFKSAMAVFVSKSPGYFSASANEYYYHMIRANPAALQVKLADIGDNLQPWRLSYLPDEKQIYLQEKYAKALEQLRS